MNEDHELCERINSSGIGLLFVGLGCPKQELWMSQYRGRIRAVMIGVGAHSIIMPEPSPAPHLDASEGPEWLHRLLSEPRRLWRRYFVTNSLFIVKTACEWAKGEL